MKLKDKLGWSSEPVFLIDGSSYLYRAYYAYPDLTRSDGFPTNALFILFRLLLKLLRQEHPQYCCFLLDGKGPNFRHELYPEYKAQRARMPEPLSQQIPLLLQGIELLGIKTMLCQGAEADDYIASFCTQFKTQIPVVIIGADKDLHQCLDEQVIIWDPGQRQEKVLTIKDFIAKNQILPSQWPDFQALTGDKVDNIPGVPGIGPKRALTLLKHCQSLEEIKEKQEELAEKFLKKLRPHLDDIFLYRELTRLKNDLPVPALAALACQKPNYEELKEFFKNLEFRSLLKEMEKGLEPTQGQEQPRTRQDKRQRNAKSQFLPGLGIKQEIFDKLKPLTQEILNRITDCNVGIFPVPKGFLLAMDQEQGSCQEFACQGGSQELQAVVSQAKTIFCPDLKSIFHSFPGLLEQQDANTQARLFDISLGAYLLHPEQRDYSLKRLSKALDLTVPLEHPARAVLAAGREIQARLQLAALDNLYTKIELPLIKVLVLMEQRGIMIDLQAFRKFLTEVKQEISALTAKIQEQAGTSFNLRSAQQLADVLFNKLGIKSKKKTPGGKLSTANQVLEGLQGEHQIIADILKFRKLEKLRSTYLDPLPKLVDRQGRVHTRFNQLATATGRLSSSDPNLQNIPIRGELGPRMRSCFVAPQGWQLVAADYSQIELRVLAHFSQDPNLLRAFVQGADIHARTAALLFEKDTDQVSADERRKAKTINFGLLYGMGPQKLARELNISLKQAKEFITLYFQKLDKLKEFYQQIEEKTKAEGLVTTLAGRRRLIPEIKSRNAQLASQGRRMAINTKIQGSAADIIKLAMLKVEKDPSLQELGAKLILQVHDELLLEVPEGRQTEAGKRIAAIMSEIVTLRVPLDVDWGVGQTWAEAH